MAESDQSASDSAGSPGGDSEGGGLSGFDPFGEQVDLESGSGIRVLGRSSTMGEARRQAADAPGDDAPGDDAPVDLTGRDLNGLRVIRKLGAGGMGEVWLAHDEDLDIQVAVKVLPPHLAGDPGFVIRFLREARAVAQLDHPNIVRVMQAGRREVSGQYVRLMVMEYVEGQDALDLLKASASKRLEPQQCAEITLACAKALKYAHGKGIIHRDVKPANVLISKAGGSIKLLDFGLARLGVRGEVVSGGASTTGTILGTPQYMPPEQCEGKLADGRADVYSLGITLYELLTGSLPFTGGTVFSIIEGHVRKPLEFPVDAFADVPLVFHELIRGMCEKKPDDRLPLKQVIEKLEHFIHGSRPSLLSSGSSMVASDVQAKARTNLTERKNSFVGRQAEIAAIAALLAEPKTSLVTVVGPGGVGKTRITQEFGLGAGAHYPGGVWFCDLTECRTADGIAAAVATGLGIPLTQVDAVAQVAASLSMREPLLLILDNFEQVVEHAAATVGVWMSKAPRATFLASSREPLHLEGERSFPLPPLKQDGIQLFIDRAVEVKRGFSADDATRATIEKIVDQLDGIPLAIELAASRCAALSPEKILERLPRRFDLLKGRRQDASARQATLRGAIDWSWNLLKPYERTALAQCSVFQGGFFLEAAEAVIDFGENDDAPFAMDVIESLVEKSLLLAYEVPSLKGEMRYRMYESIRQYGQEKLMELDGVVDALLVRYAEHYVEYAEFWDARIRTPEVLEALARIEIEAENLFTVQDAIETSRPDLAARAVLAAKETLRIRGPWTPRVSRLERAIGGLDASTYPPLRIKLYNALAVAHYECGSQEGILTATTAAINLAREYRNANPGKEADSELARSLYTRASFVDGTSISEDVLAGVSEAMALAVSSANETIRGVLLSLQGGFHHAQGEYAKALECHDEAEAIERRLGNQIGLAGSINDRGVVHQSCGEIDKALACFAEAERMNRALGNRSWLAYCLGNRGNLHYSRGEYPQSLACFTEAEGILRELGDRSGHSLCLVNLGSIHLCQGEYARAQEYFTAAESVARELGRPRALAMCVGSIGTIHAHRGDYARASTCFAESESIAREIGECDQLADVLRFRADALLQQWQYARDRDPALLTAARAAVEESRALYSDQGRSLTREFFHALSVLAGVLHDLGDRVTGRQHADAAIALAATISPLPITRDSSDPKIVSSWRWLDIVMGVDGTRTSLIPE